MHQADSHDVITVRGARVNNLRDIDLDLPKRRMTVFTGLSGSGKSSLVFGTIAAESQRLINETYSTFVQSFMPSQARPDVDELANLSAAIIVDQERLGANPRSTVGTATDAAALLRLVFSRLSQPHVGPSTAFSFNIATASGAGAVTVQKGAAIRKKAEFTTLGGMCPHCEGLGRTSEIDMTQVIDEDRSLNDGAILAPNFGTGTWYWVYYGESPKLDPDKPIKKFTKKERDYFLHGEPEKITLRTGINTTYEGLIPKIRRVFLEKDTEIKQAHIKAWVERAATFQPCPECGGTRLNKAAREATVAGRTLPEVCDLQVNELRDWVATLHEPTVAPVLANLMGILDAMVNVGLGYLSLSREAGTLSGGEAQRVKMIRHLGSSLTDITYVFDEPTIGLHPHDIARMNDLLLALRDKGNTVLVVEHKPEVMAVADHLVDLGPGAGSDGGTITFEGDLAGLRASGTLTGRYLDARMPLRSGVRTPTGAHEIRGANLNNLRHVDVDVPTGVLTVVTGVAGSGKSSLIHGSLADRDGVLVVDQTAIKGSRRSNPATYSGLLDPIRSEFAKANGVKPALFSPNSEGACPNCSGQGVIYTDLAMMAGVITPCEQCGGKRFRDDVLQYTLHGLSIADFFGLSVAQAHEVFTGPKPKKILDRLMDVGLGYVKVGQPLTTLSGGERQRLKLAASMGEASTYILDEPTSGLHLADTERLVAMLHRLVDQGLTTIVIEHNLAVIAQADWIIDIGPGAGHEGGAVVFEGTPQQMVEGSDTLTAEHLRRWVSSD
ncbi:ATP-binding cassette domain-containing protein [Propionibacteriaceae bacterium G1746]|uniref:ATP-binding cassette domain-containing protein n=1 Tax=Aestuariimicrobium sp. G57 TaxID=3418485 RepID=UPI003C1DF54D